jgi:plasmid stabilization system protein ParE
LENIVTYLFEHAPEHAERIARTIYNAPTSLLTFPFRGRPGRREGTRELVLLPLPYVVVYQVGEEIIHVVRILHAAQDWP